MKSFIGYQQYLVEEEAPTNVGIYRALQKTGEVGPHSANSAPRVSNPKNLSDKDFIALIKTTFDGASDITKLKPEEGQNTSRTWPMFLFNYGGKVDNRVWLTGEIKGRGSKQTNEQEISWLLVLSAMYYNMDKVRASEDPIEQAILNEMLDQNVYQRVYGTTGKALNKSGAEGLVSWLSGNPDWLAGHLKQCSAFTNTVGNAPARFVKDNKDIAIVAHAKEVFHTSVPDQKFDKDKWNPADVWLEYEDFSPTDFETLDDMNRYLKNSISASNGIIGVSLKKGTSGPKAINMAGHIPDYDVTGLTLEYGELLAQNVDTEYAGTELTGYSVMYRLFSASTKETIRGEADKKGSLAMHGKVFLEYLDFLSGENKVDAVESVKGIHVKMNKKTNEYEFTRDGAKAFSKVKSAWKKLQSSDIFTYNSRGQKDTMDYIRLFNGTTKVKESKQAFLKYITEIGKAKKISEVSMQTRLSARFQTIVLGAIFAKMKQENKTEFFWIVLGMLLYGKSESQWSAPHLKVE